MEESKGKIIGNICCLGVSYVGVPVSTVIAHMCPSLNVAVVDLSPEKTLPWNTKQIPTREPGLEEILKKCQNRNLVFTTDTEGAIKAADIIFISIISPMNSHSCKEEKTPDISDFEKAARLIADVSENNKIIVQKNIVPSGSNDIIKRILHANKNPNVDFQVLTVPEFFSAGNAIHSLLNPDRVLIGSDETPASGPAVDKIVSIYSQWVPREKIITMSNWSAELAKLSVNAFLAQRLSSVGAMGILCESSRADVSEVVNIIGKSSEIGSQYLEPSVSFGGSHLKNDLMCLVFLCEHMNLTEVAEYWKQVLIMNEYQKKRFKKKILSSFFNTLGHKSFAVWGAAFKKNVDIAKDSPAVDICYSLLSEGAKVRVYDPKVEKRQLLDELMTLGLTNCEKLLTYHDDPYEAAKKTHAIIVCTNCEEFSNVDYSVVYKDMLRPAYIFDARKCLPHEDLIKIGFTVKTIGKEFQQTCLQPETTQFV